MAQPFTPIDHKSNVNSAMRMHKEREARKVRRQQIRQAMLEVLVAATFIGVMLQLLLGV